MPKTVLYIDFVGKYLKAVDRGLGDFGEGYVGSSLFCCRGVSERVVV